MIYQSTILSTHALAGSDVLRENLASRRDVSVSGFYVPSGQKLSFSPTPGVDRLHLLLRGRCRLVQGGTQLQVKEGHALGIGAPGAHQLEADAGGMAFFTVAVRRGDDTTVDTGGGLTILDVLGSGRPNARRRLDDWVGKPTVGGRMALLPLEQLPPGPVQVFPASERLLLVLEGTLHVETPTGVQALQAPCLFELAPDTPHRLLPGPDSRTTVLSISDPEPAESITNHFACGHRARFCDLVQLSGDGMVQLGSSGDVMSLNGPAVRWLGIPDTSWRGHLRARLLPRDGGWLAEQLERPMPGGPVRTVWASPSMPDLALSVLFVPYQGEHRLSSALLYLRPMVAPPETPSPQPIPEASAAGLELNDFIAQTPQMAEIRARLSRLSADAAWVVVWGEPGTGRSTVARLLHRLSSTGMDPFRVLNCEKAHADVEGLLYHLRPELEGVDERWLEPGPWLQNLGAGTLFLESFHALPASTRNRIFRHLSDLKAGGKVVGRVVVELDQRPQKGLPGVTPGPGVPRRGAFVTLALPPLRDRPEDMPLLLREFLEKALPAGSSMPTLSGDALELLLSHAFPQNLLELERLARALAASPLGGALSAAAVRPLLGKRRHEALFGAEDQVPTLAVAERELLMKALRRAGGNKAEAARLLGVTRTRLYRMLIEHQLEL